MKKQSSPSRFRVVLRLFALLMLLLGVAEISLRIAYSSRPEQILYSNSYEGGKGIAGSPDYDFHLNSQGYKDTEFFEKKQGSFRILALGDSFTFGNVPYAKSYIRLLETKLTRTIPRSEILNLGLPGVGLNIHLAILAREGLDLHPDMLLLSIFIGDDILQSEARRYYSYSYLLSWVNSFIKERRHYEGRRYHPEDDYCDSCQALPEEAFVKLQHERLFMYRKGDKQLLQHLNYTKFYLQKILEICQRHAITPVVVLIPTVLQSSPSLQKTILSASHMAGEMKAEWQWSQPNDLLKDYLRENNVHYIDLLPPFSKNTAANFYRTRDIHWSLAGHARAAEFVAAALALPPFSLSQCQ